MNQDNVIPLPLWTEGQPIVVDREPGIVVEAFVDDDARPVLGVRMAILEVVDYLAGESGTYAVELAFSDGAWRREDGSVVEVERWAEQQTAEA